MNPSTVRIATASYPITAFKDFDAWRAHVSAWVAKAADQGADLVLFPEYGSLELLSTFPPSVQQDIDQNLTALQPVLDDFCETFAALADRYRLTLVAPSLPVWVDEKFINRVYVFGKSGRMGWQDKFFMTRFEDEDWGVSGAENVLTVFEADWGKFGIQICYDVEFGLGSAALCAAGAQFILVPSCTETIRGATRVHVGARARALENQCYVAVSQTVGDALWSPLVDYNYGFAAIYTPPDAGMPEEGILASLKPNQADWLIQDLDLSLLATVRNEGQVFNFKDHQRITQYLGDEKPRIRHIQI